MVPGLRFLGDLSLQTTALSGNKVNDTPRGSLQFTASTGFPELNVARKIAGPPRSLYRDEAGDQSQLSI